MNKIFHFKPLQMPDQTKVIKVHDCYDCPMYVFRKVRESRCNTDDRTEKNRHELIKKCPLKLQPLTIKLKTDATE